MICLRYLPNVKYLVFCTVNVEEDVAEQEIMEIKIAKFQQSLCYLSVLVISVKEIISLVDPRRVIIVHKVC